MINIKSKIKNMFSTPIYVYVVLLMIAILDGLLFNSKGLYEGIVASVIVSVVVDYGSTKRCVDNEKRKNEKIMQICLADLKECCKNLNNSLHCAVSDSGLCTDLYRGNYYYWIDALFTAPIEETVETEIICFAGVVECFKAPSEMLISIFNASMNVDFMEKIKYLRKLTKICTDVERCIKRKQYDKVYEILRDDLPSILKKISVDNSEYFDTKYNEQIFINDKWK